MNKNIRIAKQLVKLAKELVASKSIKAYEPYFEQFFGIDKTNFERIDTYEQLVEKCEGVDSSNCCLLREDGKRYFNQYGAPFYVYCQNGKCVIMHCGSKQIKDENDAPVTNNRPENDKILNEAACTFFLYGVEGYWKYPPFKFENAIKQCTGDFVALIPYLQKAFENYKQKIKEDVEAPEPKTLARGNMDLDDMNYNQ